MTKETWDISWWRKINYTEESKKKCKWFERRVT